MLLAPFRYFQSPLTDCQIAKAASAAVSARRMRGPRVTGVTKERARWIQWVNAT
jgi:hypothetical protein